MLKPIQSKTFQAGDAPFAIVASRYNARYVDAMLRAAKAQLKRAGAKQVRVIRVPGAYEIPLAAARLAKAAAAARPAPPAPSAIIFPGGFLRGQNVHPAPIGEAVSQALMQIQLQYQVPVIHEVLLLENQDQARVRCLGKTHNRGAEAAQTALAMAQVMAKLRP